MTVEKYEGVIEIGDVFTAPDNYGILGFRRVRVIGRDPSADGLLILEEMPSRIKYARVGSIFRCPEVNLRIVFQPE